MTVRLSGIWLQDWAAVKEKARRPQFFFVLGMCERDWLEERANDWVDGRI